MKPDGLDDREALEQLRAVLQFAADSYHGLAAQMTGESRSAVLALGEHYDRGVMLVDDRIESLTPTQATPAVDLPTEPTWGVLSWIAGSRTERAGQQRSLFAHWYPAPCISRWPHRSSGEPATQFHAEDLGLQVPIDRIISFDPADVVSKSSILALEKALHTFDGGKETSFSSVILRRAIDTFLREGAANGADQ